LDGEAGGADRSRELAELGWHDGNSHARRPPFYLIELSPERLKQRGTALGDATAEDDDFWIESVDQGSDADGQVADARLPTLRGHLVAAGNGF
jgi:hypothetical protein